MDGEKPCGDHTPVTRKQVLAMTLEQILRMRWEDRVKFRVRVPPNKYQYRWKRGRMTPAEKDFRRCHHKSRNTRTRCRFKAIDTSLYCWLHAGRIATRNRNRKWRLYNSMPGMYSKHMGPALMAKVSEFLNQPVADQVSLYDELALARGLVAKALDMDAKVEAAKAIGTKVSAETEASVHEALRSAINDVGDLVERIVKIEKQAEGQISITQLAFFVGQLTRLIYEVLKDHPALAETLVSHIRTNLRMPADPRGLLGTSGVVIPAPISGLEAIEVQATDAETES